MGLLEIIPLWVRQSVRQAYYCLLGKFKRLTHHNLTGKKSDQPINTCQGRSNSGQPIATRPLRSKVTDTTTAEHGVSKFGRPTNHYLAEKGKDPSAFPPFLAGNVKPGEPVITWGKAKVRPAYYSLVGKIKVRPTHHYLAGKIKVWPTHYCITWQGRSKSGQPKFYLVGKIKVRPTHHYLAGKV